MHRSGMQLACVVSLCIAQPHPQRTLGSSLEVIDGSTLQIAVNASIAAGAHSFNVSSGAYYFDDGSPLLIYRAKNWSLSAAGPVELWFRVSQKWATGGVLIKECEDIAISGLTVDYDPPAHYQGEVIAIAPPHSPTAKAACYRRMNIELSKCLTRQPSSLHQYNRTTKIWTTVAGVNCFPGHGGQIPLGPEPWPCCHDNTTGTKTPTPVTQAACQQACSSDPNCSAVVTGPFDDNRVSYSAASASAPAGMVLAQVRTDPGFPDPHAYLAAHGTAAADPSLNYMNEPAIWPRKIGYGCNRTLGCPGHGAGVLLPLPSPPPTPGQSPALPADVAMFKLLASAEVGDKVTISMRKGITWHVQNSTRVSTSRVAIHGASLFGLSEFDGGGDHSYTDVWLGRRAGPGAAPGQDQAQARDQVQANGIRSGSGRGRGSGSGDRGGNGNGGGSHLCGRPPGRLCFGVLASNADAFHSSGCRRGPTLRNVTLSSNFDDFLNVHSRMQLLADINITLLPAASASASAGASVTAGAGAGAGTSGASAVLIVLDPRLRVAQGAPDDTPYGAAETLPNARPGMVLDFHALNTFEPRGSATITAIERIDDRALVERYGAAAAAATGGGAYGKTGRRMAPAMGGNVAPDVGQLCGAFADAHSLPRCASRVWRVTVTLGTGTDANGNADAGADVSAAGGFNASLFDLASLRGWDNRGLDVRGSHFFGGIDGVHVKSSGAVLANNTMACTDFDASPWQHYLEGPPHLADIIVVNNTFTACGGRYGAYTVDCSGRLAAGFVGLPTFPGGGGWCNGVGGKGRMSAGTCDMASMRVEGNGPAADCTVFGDAGAQRTCCCACGPRCMGCT